MCRHLVYLGRPVSLAELLFDAAALAERQSWAPRRQRHGSVNADGFGAGWYARTAPSRSATGGPSRCGPTRRSPSLAPTMAIAASSRRSVGDAGLPAGRVVRAPFTARRWLFSHNGRSPTGRGAQGLADRTFEVPEAAASRRLGAAVRAGRRPWRAGDALADGLRDACGRCSPHGGGRFNLLAGDGATIAATVSATPCSSRAARAVVLASEP